MTSYITLHSFALLNLEIVERKGKNEYPKDEKNFLDEIKTFFIVFEGL